MVTPSSRTSASTTSSNPTWAIRPRNPARRSARSAPIVTRFWLVNRAVRWLRLIKNGPRLLLSLFGGGQVLVDQLIRNAEAGRPKGREVSGVAFARGADVGPISEVRDAPVTVIDQVGDCSDGALVVIRSDGVGGDEGWVAVEEHDLGSRALLPDKVAMVATRRYHEQAIRATVDQCPREILFLGRVLVETAGQHEDAAGSGDLLDRPVHHSGKRIGDVLQQQTDGRGAAVAATE